MQVRFRQDFTIDIPGGPGRLRIPAGTAVRVTQLDTPPRFREPEVRIEVPIGPVVLDLWLPEFLLEQAPMGVI